MAFPLFGEDVAKGIYEFGELSVESAHLPTDGVFGVAGCPAQLGAIVLNGKGVGGHFLKTNVSLTSPALRPSILSNGAKEIINGEGKHKKNILFTYKGWLRLVIS